MPSPSNKVIESTSLDSVHEAAKIWKTIPELKIPANKEDAMQEADLSVRTWIDCNSEIDFEAKRDRYQRLNDAVIDHFLVKAREKNQDYPPLKRFHTRIGKMTTFLADKDVTCRRKTAETHFKKAISINEGMELKRNIPQEFAQGFTEKLIEDGYDPRYAAQLSIEINREIKLNERIGEIPRHTLTKMIAEDLLSTLNRNPAIIAKDQQLLEMGKKDKLAESNKNIPEEKRKGSKNEV